MNRDRKTLFAEHSILTSEYAIVVSQCVTVLPRLCIPILINASRYIFINLTILFFSTGSSQLHVAGMYFYHYKIYAGCNKVFRFVLFLFFCVEKITSYILQIVYTIL